MGRRYLCFARRDWTVRRLDGKRGDFFCFLSKGQDGSFLFSTGRDGTFLFSVSKDGTRTFVHLVTQYDGMTVRCLICLLDGYCMTVYCRIFPCRSW